MRRLKLFYLRWTRLSLSTRILICLGIGIFAGLFVGEPIAVLQPIADIYIRLMQMTVLPYLITALIIAFGQLSKRQAKRLALRGTLLLVVVWICASLVVITMALAFPEFESASFFSVSLTEPHQPFSLTDIYFTSNLFESLSQNIVPAVVLFSCLMGISLIGLAGKERMLEPLKIWNKAIVRITGFVIQLTPVGVLAIGAVTAGTMDLETFSRLEVYFIAFMLASLLLAYWILPLLVTAVTPFSYSEVTGIARDALLTAFVTHSVFIVLPILIERSKELLSKHGLLDENADATTEVLIPVMFNFPNAGKLLTLLFLPFAAWLSGAPLLDMDYAYLLAVGIPSYFAKAQVALPYLLDVFGLPQDMFQLYIPTAIITGKFDSLVSAMNLVVFALLGAGSMSGFLVFERYRVVKAILKILIGTAVIVIIARLIFALAINTDYKLGEEVRQMREVLRLDSTVVHKNRSNVESIGRALSFQEIQARGSLRIGFNPEDLPMSFYNESGILVGFDVELGEKLAMALNLKAEFVPVRWSEVPRLLREGVIDVMPGVWLRPYWFSKVDLSDPYFVGTIALATLDERRHEFSTLEKIHRHKDLRIAVPLETGQIEHSLQHYFEGIDVQFTAIEDWRSFFEGDFPEIDAFLLPAEHASGWSLQYPHYTVVVPQPNPVKIPSAFGVAKDSTELANSINEWIIFAESAGLIRESYDYWILGQGIKIKQQRWSIMRNVLGWGD